MKPYRSTRSLLAEIQQALTSKPTPAHSSPLEAVIELLAEGRHYAWAGIYLAVGENSTGKLLGASRDAHPTDVTLPETRAKILVSMKIAGREYGVLAVKSAHENALGMEDRVFLERVADALARFFANQGKYIVRKARSAAQGGAQKISSAAGQR